MIHRLTELLEETRAMNAELSELVSDPRWLEIVGTHRCANAPACDFPAFNTDVYCSLCHQQITDTLNSWPVIH